MKLKNVLIALLVLPLSLLKAQDYKQRAQKLDSILTAYTSKNMFTGSVLVAKDGNVLLKKGYGMANLSFFMPNIPATKFKLASVSKQFTAMSIMLLAEQKKLNLNDTLKKFIPDYPNGDKITVYQLVTHTSGIKNFTGLPVYDSIMTMPHTIEKCISYFKDQPLDFEPGTKFNYSNSGYVLLTYIVEKVSGKTMQNFLQENIFGPLGMKNSGMFEGNAIVHNLAVGYTENDEGTENAPYIDMSIPFGAGALYSTVEDLYIWDQSLYSNKLINKESTQKLFTPNLEGYAFGFMVDTFQKHLWVFHTGGIEGFSTAINRFPDDKLTIIILKNNDNQNLLNANRLARSVMFDVPFELPVERKAISVDYKIMQKLTGVYELAPGFSITVFIDKGKLYAQATQQPAIRLFAEEEYKYFCKSVNAQMNFGHDKKGNITTLTLVQNGRETTGKRQEK